MGDALRLILDKACVSDDVAVVRKILTDNPTFDVNERLNGNGWTVLHYACHYGQHEIVSLLLGYPDINVNQKTTYGSTPFNLGCYNGKVEAVKILLKDLRVDISMPDLLKWTPLTSASYRGKLQVIKWMIASGRELTNFDLKGELFDEKFTAIEGAKRWGHTVVVSLLENLVAYPVQTRHEIRSHLGLAHALAAELFSTVVFLCDDYLRIKKKSRKTNAARFFDICSRLPMELQMILCCRVHGSAKDIIPFEYTEAAFKSAPKKRCKLLNNPFGVGGWQ